MAARHELWLMLTEGLSTCFLDNCVHRSNERWSRGFEGHRIRGDTAGIIGAGVKTGDWVKEKMRGGGTVEGLPTQYHSLEKKECALRSTNTPIIWPR